MVDPASFGQRAVGAVSTEMHDEQHGAIALYLGKIHSLLYRDSDNVPDAGKQHRGRIDD
jgi:hypothetical protein